MVVPSNMLGFVESAGLAAVAYGQGTQERISAATDFVSSDRSPVSKLRGGLESVGRIWAEKGATLMTLAENADLLLAGMSEQGPAANIAEYHRIPLAALHFFPAEGLTSSSGALYSGLMKQAADAQRRALGLPDASASSQQPLADDGPLEIQAYDEILFPEASVNWGARRAQRPFVGALTLELPTDADEEVLAWIAEGRPPIYFGFGSTPVQSPFHAAAMISAACAELEERALICSGASDFSPVPDSGHTMLVGAVNHATILPACRAVVHAGGAGITAAGLRAGKPTLILWVWSDQPLWAGAVNQLEVGSGRPFFTTTQESLVADLRSILTPHCVTRALEVAAQMTKPAESVATAADLLENAARRGRSD